MASSEIQTFDGLDNRREMMILLDRLGSNQRRAKFIESLIPQSAVGFANCPMTVANPAKCDPIAAYYMVVALANELGVSINTIAQRLDAVVRKMR